jgi:hypothetical protein
VVLGLSKAERHYKKDAFPLPLISDCIDLLTGNKYMSTLDMAAGYWQIEIAPEDKKGKNCLYHTVWAV